jgi:hypothetical protein
MEKIQKILFLPPIAYIYIPDRGEHTDVILDWSYEQVCLDKRTSNVNISMEEFVLAAVQSTRIVNQLSKSTH